MEKRENDRRNTHPNDEKGEEGGKTLKASQGVCWIGGARLMVVLGTDGGIQKVHGRAIYFDHRGHKTVVGKK